VAEYLELLANWRASLCLEGPIAIDVLDVSSRGIDNEAAVSLFRGLTKLRIVAGRINIAFNFLYDAGVSALCCYLWSFSVSILDLNLAGNRLTKVGIAELLACLSCHTSHPLCLHDFPSPGCLKLFPLRLDLRDNLLVDPAGFMAEFETPGEAKLFVTSEDGPPPLPVLVDSQSPVPVLCVFLPCFIQQRSLKHDVEKPRASSGQVQEPRQLRNSRKA